MHSNRWMSGEMMAFGIPEGAAQEFLEQRGFREVQDANAKFLHEAYFHGVNEKRTIAHGYAIASAIVKSRP
jgi:O-methyltransferase involved in polyketide biosynthesis